MKMKSKDWNIRRIVSRKNQIEASKLWCKNKRGVKYKIRFNLTNSKNSFGNVFHTERPKYRKKNSVRTKMKNNVGDDIIHQICSWPLSQPFSDCCVSGVFFLHHKTKGRRHYKVGPKLPRSIYLISTNWKI